jgi:hypothetical protein
MRPRHVALSTQERWFENLDPKLVWPDHPVFAKMSRKAWCVLGYRHMDHHLRQFGV